MSEMPELRPGRPWAMEEMIDAEPGLVDAGLAEPAAAELATRVVRARAAGEPVVIVGCGTSEHAALAGAAVLNEALGVGGTGRVVARDAFEAALDPYVGGLFIGVSHEGATAATVAAAEAAAGSGADVVLITARPDRAHADWFVVPTPLVDRSWCHTVGYLSPLLAMCAVGARLVGRTPDAAAVGAAIDMVRSRRDELRAHADRIAGCAHLLAVGSGVDEVSARELALKVEEGAHVGVTPLGLEKLLHGHLPACDARTGIVLLRFDPRAGERRDRRAQDALRSVAELGMPSVLIEHRPPADLPPVAGALLTGAITLQLLTLELVHRLGTNPDLIRREEEPYRRAAAMAEESGTG